MKTLSLRVSEYSSVSEQPRKLSLSRKWQIETGHVIENIRVPSVAVHITSSRNTKENPG